MGAASEEGRPRQVPTAEVDSHCREDSHHRRHGRLQAGVSARGPRHRRIRVPHRHHRLQQPVDLRQRSHRQRNRHELRPAACLVRETRPTRPSVAPIS